MPGSGGAGQAGTVPMIGGAVRAADAITLGVGEEFVLLDPSTGAPVCGPELVRMLGGGPGIQQELMRFQVETGTRVCTALDDLGRELIRLRPLAAAAAASGLPAGGLRGRAVPHARAGRPIGPAPVPGLARRYGPVVAEAHCACHIHVGAPSRDRASGAGAAAALARRCSPSPPTPRSRRHDTGWASWRYAIQSRWPTAVPPAVWPDAAAYDAEVRRLIERGAALDERSVYFLARLSPRYPTVEVRVADVCLNAGAAVLLAGLTRALVATALAEARRGTPAAAAPARQVAAALAAAAPRGLAGAGADPFTGQAVDAAALRARLLDHSTPRSATTATPNDTRCCAGLNSKCQEPAASGPCSPAPIRARVHHRTRPRGAVRLPAGPLAPAPCPGPGSGRRAVGSEEEQYSIIRPHLEHWQPRQWCCASRLLSSRPRSHGSVQPRPQRSALVTSIHPAAARLCGFRRLGSTCPRAPPV